MDGMGITQESAQRESEAMMFFHRYLLSKGYTVYKNRGIPKMDGENNGKMENPIKWMI